METTNQKRHHHQRCHSRRFVRIWSLPSLCSHRCDQRGSERDGHETTHRRPRNRYIARTTSRLRTTFVLHAGWGAVSFLKHIDTQKYDVVCISPRNYFLMTPLLPSVTVGTVETRTVIESIRSLIGPHIKYIEANCVDVDVQGKAVTCNEHHEPTTSDINDLKDVHLPPRENLGASSRVKLDSGIRSAMCRP